MQYSYSLSILRYHCHINFDTLEELRKELRLHFTPAEIALGIIDRLTAFDNHRKDELGCTCISYQDIKCYRYPMD